METLAIGSATEVAKDLLGSGCMLGFGTFLVWVIVDELRTKVWRRVRYLVAGGVARARIVTSVKTNQSERKPKYQLTVDFTTRYGTKVSGVELAQKSSWTGRRGDVVHVLYEPLRPGGAVRADWLGMLTRVLVAAPILLGAGGYFMVLGVTGVVLAFR